MFVWEKSNFSRQINPSDKIVGAYILYVWNIKFTMLSLFYITVTTIVWDLQFDSSLKYIPWKKLWSYVQNISFHPRTSKKSQFPGNKTVTDPTIFIQFMYNSHRFFCNSLLVHLVQNSKLGKIQGWKFVMSKLKLDTQRFNLFTQLK